MNISIYIDVVISNTHFITFQISSNYSIAYGH